MKKLTLGALLAGCVLGLSMQVVLADEVPTPISPMSAILEKLQTKGYINIQKIKFEDGKFEVKVIDAKGREQEFDVNPQSGEILNAPKPKAFISALEAAQKVEAAGYQNIYKMKVDDDEYEVKALDKNGKKVGLDVDAVTGKVTKKWFD